MGSGAFKEVVLFSRGRKYDNLPYILKVELEKHALGAELVELKYTCDHNAFYKGGDTLWLNGKKLSTKIAKVVVFRGFDDVLLKTPYKIDSADHLIASTSHAAFVYGLFGLFKNSTWINNPVAINRAKYKIQQLNFAEELGFLVPPSLVTNNYSDVKNFLVNHPNSIIKPLGPHIIIGNKKFIYTNKLARKDLIGHKDSISMAPFIVQKFIESDLSYRVTVIGKKVFSIGINPVKEADKMDWRRYDKTTKYKIMQLPSKVRNGCIAMTRAYGLVYSTIDLIMDKEGDIYFLEINPSGQYSWLEKMCDVKITDYFVKYIKTLVN